MRCWSWELDCPKCGSFEMKPRWAGLDSSVWAQKREFVQLGFSARCGVCGYEEEVLPLDECEDPDDEPDTWVDLSPWIQSVTLEPDETEFR